MKTKYPRTSNVNIRVNPKVKKDAEEIYELASKQIND